MFPSFTGFRRLKPCITDQTKLERVHPQTLGHSRSFRSRAGHCGCPIHRVCQNHAHSYRLILVDRKITECSLTIDPGWYKRFGLTGPSSSNTDPPTILWWHTCVSVPDRYAFSYRRVYTLWKSTYLNLDRNPNPRNHGFSQSLSRLSTPETACLDELLINMSKFKQKTTTKTHAFGQRLKHWQIRDLTRAMFQQINCILLPIAAIVERGLHHFSSFRPVARAVIEH